MSIDTSKIKDQARDGVADALGDAYDCMRVWSAWGVGTMGSEDFALVAEDTDRLEEITDAALAPALAAIDALTAEVAALRTALEEMVNEPQPAGIDRPAYQMALAALDEDRRVSPEAFVAIHLQKSAPIDKKTHRDDRAANKVILTT